LIRDREIRREDDGHIIREDERKKAASAKKLRRAVAQDEVVIERVDARRRCIRLDVDREVDLQLPERRGPDGRTYRLDSYVRAVQSVAVGNPRSTKLVTVVVRDPATNNRVVAREESDFDYCTALPDPSGTGAPC
jgi:hypothetical protein